MITNEKDLFIDYMAPMVDAVDKKIVPIGGAVIGGLMFILGISAGEMTAAVIGLVIAGAAVSTVFSNKKNMDQYREGALSLLAMNNGMLADFMQAESVLRDSLRLGRNWAYGCETNNAVAYGDIRRLYLRINKLNGTERFQCLMAELVRGGEVSLCTLPAGGYSEIEIDRAVAELRRRNPSIQL